MDKPFDRLADATARFATLARSLEQDDLEVVVDTDARTVGDTVRHVCEQYRAADPGQAVDRPFAGPPTTSVASNAFDAM